MSTWQAALVRVEDASRFVEAARRHRIRLADTSTPWVLVDVEPQLGKLGPPSFASDLSKDLNTSVIAFFVQTTVTNERVEHWEDGELVRELEYHLDGGGWIAQGGTPQPWEADYFFSEHEGTGEGEQWPGNLSDDLSQEEMSVTSRLEQRRRRAT